MDGDHALHGSGSLIQLGTSSLPTPERLQVTISNTHARVGIRDARKGRLFAPIADFDTGQEFLQRLSGTRKKRTKRNIA